MKIFKNIYTRLNMSLVHFLKSDWMETTLEDMILNACISRKHSNWKEYLLMAKSAYNTTTKLSPSMFLSKG